MELSPQSRFKGFSDIWRAQTIGDCFSERKERSGEGEMISVTINSGIRKAKDLDRTVHINDTSKYKVVRKGDIAYNSMRMWQGASGYSPYDGILSPAYTVITPRENILSEFFAYLFKHPELIHVFELNSQGLTSDTWNLKYDKLKNIVVSFPDTTDEQLIIAQFFSRLDALIAAEDKKLEKLKNLKNASLEKMFPRKGESVPQVRFKGFTGHWEEHKLSDFLTVYVEKNDKAKYSKYDIFSVSNECGVINQIKYQGKSLAGASLNNYNVTHKNSIIYTKSPLKNQPYGIIKTNLDCSGIVSALYAVYSVNKNVSPEFVQIYFSYDNRLNDYLRPIVNKGAKNTLLVSDEGALSGTVIFPSDKNEQQIIASFFINLDTMIDAHTQKLDKLRYLKKSFLEKMFVTAQ